MATTSDEFTAAQYMARLKTNSNEALFGHNTDVRDRTERLMQESLRKYLDPNERAKMIPAEKVFLKALVIYLTQSLTEGTGIDKKTKIAIAQAFDYLHGQGIYNYENGKLREGRPGVGLYLAKIMGIKNVGPTAETDGYRACLLDVASRIDASLAVIPVDKWEEWGKKTPQQQCAQLASAAANGKLNGILGTADKLGIGPDALVPTASENMPEFMVVSLLETVATKRPGKDSYGFQEVIARSIDDLDLLKVINEVILKSDNRILLDAAVEAYKEDEQGSEFPDPLAERSPTNPVESTFDLIKKAQKEGLTITVDMAKLADSPKLTRKIRRQLLCQLNQLPSCPYDCGKCDLCDHAKTCKTCGVFKGGSCTVTQKDEAKAKIWRDFLTGSLDQAVNDMFRRSSGNQEIYSL